MAKTNNPKILIFILVVAAAFLAGATWGKRSGGNQNVAGARTDGQASVTFAPEQSKKPNFKFFVMSYCPYGNQAENGIKPVVELLGDLVEWEPHYIVNKISQQQITQMCQSRTYTEELCQQYVDQGYFPDQEVCKANLYQSEDECFEQETEQCLATEDSNFYCSLHGKQELNQNIREICAWNLTDDHKKWWQFIDLTNNQCQLDNIDQCWQDKADQAGLDVNKIQDCFNKNAIELLDKEIAVSQEFSVSGSPSLFVNDAAYPPEGAYDQEGKANMQIGNEIFSQLEYRSPEAFKQAICSAFNRLPKECKETLSRENELGSGSCD